MRVFNDFNELKAAVGTEVGVSDWIEITQDRINKFAEATGDEQWIHVDTERAARESPGGTTIAHGLLSLSLIPMFIRDDHRGERPEKHLELRRQPDSLSHPGPGRLTAAGRVSRDGGGGCAA